LRAIHCEAVKILNKLLAGPPAEIVRSLCKRFYILQEYFVMRYQDARAYAISLLGYVDAASVLDESPGSERSQSSPFQ
jgi:hypothetical protein